MDIKQTIARRIKMARSERDINQAELGELIGVNAPYITKIESGRIDIRVETLDRIARALRKPISFFFEPVEEVSLARAAAEPPVEYVTHPKSHTARRGGKQGARK